MLFRSTEILESLLREFCQRDEHLRIGVLAEILDADISGVVIEHIGSGDTLGRYLATGDAEGLHLLAAIADDTNLHLGILRTLEAVHRFLIGDNLAYERLAIYGYNLITCQQSSLFGYKEISTYISACNGGDGVGRDVVEQVLRAKGLWLSDAKAFGW